MVVPYARQDVSAADIDSVVEVLRSDYLTQGPTVPRFETAVTQRCSVAHGVATSSASAALHIACLALGVGPGDRVWTSAVTFVASANCALACGASVDFVDIDPRTYNMSTAHLEEKLVEASKSGLLPKVVIPVHLTGQSCEMQDIFDLSRRFGFRVLEDASHAIGSRYRDRSVGSCEFSDISVFSFHPVKIITTGEGGLATTNNEDLARKMALYRSHGITRDPQHFVGKPDGRWYYEQVEFGFNYRMTDVAAALGISQLNRLDEFLQSRHAIAQNYDRLFAQLPVTVPWQHPDTYSSFHLYVIRPDLAEIGASHSELFERLAARGIAANLHYIPVYRHPFYAARGYRRSDFPNAEDYYSNAISIPMFPGLTLEQQEATVGALLAPRGHQTLF